MSTIKHLGLRLQTGRRDFYISRDNYIEYATKKPSFRFIEGAYTEEEIAEKTERALLNYDLNMEFFDSLSEEEFQQEVDNFLKTFREFKDCKDLSRLQGVSGYYVMVLDNYKQVYIGTSSNIAKRIRQHWMTTKPLDRLVFGDVNRSILSIDTFRAKDTTRVLVARSNKIYEREHNYLSAFSPKFTLNRLSGGLMESPLEIFINQRHRKDLKNKK